MPDAQTPDACNASRARLLVIGSVNMDMLLQVDRAPSTDGAVLVHRAIRMPGGHAANCAAALRAMGAEIALVGAVGNDQHGRQLTDDLVARGIDTADVEIRADQSTGEVIIPTSGADHSMFVLRGANDHAAIDLPRSIVRFEPDALVIFDPSPQIFEQLRAFRRRATASRLPIYWIPGGINCEDVELGFMLEVADVIIVNATEHAALVAHASAATWKEGRCELITTLGARGARYQCGSRDFSVGAEQTRVKDTIGAGDAFTAAYILARQAERSPEARLRLANAAGAVAVRSAGARAGAQGLAELGQALNSIPRSAGQAVQRALRDSGHGARDER